MTPTRSWLIPDRWTSMPWWTRGRTPIARGLLRVLGVAFTIHYALWAMVIAVDLLAVQCGKLPSCYNQRWLGWFDEIRERLADPAALMVTFTAVPLLLIGLLWLLGRRNARSTTCSSARRTSGGRPPSSRSRRCCMPPRRWQPSGPRWPGR